MGRYLFLAADRDGDGSLDRAEFLAFSHPEEDETMKPLIVDQVIFERGHGVLTTFWYAVC